MLAKLIFSASFFFCSFALSQVINEIPQQEDLSRPFMIAQKDGYTITALAKFELTARVLGIETYSLDKGSDLSPYDFALGWKEMSSEKFLSKIKITQSNRFYFWHTDDNVIYSQRDKIKTQSANMHLIPANKQIKKILDRIDKNENVYIKGYLVKVNKDNWRWTSSMTRTDTGAGACELIWVTEVSPM
jgi:hypothetical protein